VSSVSRNLSISKTLHTGERLPAMPGEKREARLAAGFASSLALRHSSSRRQLEHRSVAVSAAIDGSTLSSENSGAKPRARPGTTRSNSARKPKELVVGAYFTTCFTVFDVLPAKSRSPPYTAVTFAVPTFRVEVVKRAEPPLNAPVPSTVVHS